MVRGFLAFKHYCKADVVEPQLSVTSVVEWAYDSVTIMSQSTLAQLEEPFSQLPLSEQKQLLERLARRVNAQTDNGDEELLTQMAADPDIQRELRDQRSG